MPEPCSEQGCPRAASVRGLCSSHYDKLWREKIRTGETPKLRGRGEDRLERVQIRLPASVAEWVKAHTEEARAALVKAEIESRIL